MIRSVKKVNGLVPIKNVIISVFDKTGLDILVPGLIKNCPDVMIYSTGGTFKAIKEILGPKDAKKHLKEVSEYTQQPETEGGLVKTLHHKLFLGYLTETYCEAHQEDMKRENAVPIDLVVMNLYPFAEVIKRPGVTIEEARGNIDVGGPSTLRAAVKNWHRVMTLPKSDWYPEFLKSLEINGGKTDPHMRFLSLYKTFHVLSSYDTEIFKYFSSQAKFKDAEAIYEFV
jgi:phosphoribosylaminoimidazolecarboxamide formyltransferase/IMP cyclohydrolase